MTYCLVPLPSGRATTTRVLSSNRFLTKTLMKFKFISRRFETVVSFHPSLHDRGGSRGGRNSRDVIQHSQQNTFSFGEELLVLDN